MVDNSNYTEAAENRNVRRRTFLRASGGAAALATLAGCTGGGGDGGDNGSNGTTTGSGNGNGNGGERYHFAFSPFYIGDQFYSTLVQTGRWYAQDHNIQLSVANAEADVTKQVQDLTRLINQGVDGIAMAATDPEATTTIAERASENGVPIFTFDGHMASSYVKMFTGFSNYQGASLVAEKVVSGLEQMNGSPSGTVVEVQLPQNLATAVQRHEGFADVLSEYSDIELLTVETDITQEDAQTKVTNLLQSEGSVDALYAQNPVNLLGALNALQNNGIKKEVGECGHVSTTLLGGSDVIIDQIKDGFVDSAVTQTPIYYSAIPMHYMKKYLDEGRDDSVIPEIGSTLTAGDLTIQGNEHNGVNPYESPRWAPAEVRDIAETADIDASHPHFQTAPIEISRENADDPQLWGNVARNI
jgi:ABC-type sugar transport system substrate-binding protein